MFPTPKIEGAGLLDPACTAAKLGWISWCAPCIGRQSHFWPPSLSRSHSQTVRAAKQQVKPMNRHRLVNLTCYENLPSTGLREYPRGGEPVLHLKADTRGSWNSHRYTSTASSWQRQIFLMFTHKLLLKWSPQIDKTLTWKLQITFRRGAE